MSGRATGHRDAGPRPRTPDPAGVLDRLESLEPGSRLLEPDARDRAPVRAAALSYAETFLDRIRTLKTYEGDARAGERIRRLPIGEEGTDIEVLLDLLRDAVDTPGINPASGGHLGYIPGGGIYHAALGDYLADVTNRYSGIHFANPGAVEMENLLLEWMAELVGYPADVGGNLASGGSIANLIALVSAREAHGLRAADFAHAVIYLTRQTHHCVDKALRVAGMGEAVRRYVPVDERYRMRPEALAERIAADREEGLLPWVAVASAGTTDVGAIDPLEAIADVADAADVWLHVDAAYGGFFVLVDEVRPRLAAMGRSDSVVLDPHKGLFLPYGTGAVLVRDREAMRRAHAYDAPYLRDAASPDRVLSPAELSPELTKHFRGLRLWLPLMLHGLAPFRACLEEKLLLTRHFHARVREMGFEVGPDPELSVSTYRWVPPAGDADAFNRRLLQHVHDDGRVFISSTTLDGRLVLRMAALAFRTHLDEVEILLEVLAEGVALLEGGEMR